MYNIWRTEFDNFTMTNGLYIVVRSSNCSVVVLEAGFANAGKMELTIGALQSRTVTLLPIIDT